MRPDKTFFYDYYALKDQDIESWSDSFFWPVARETTTQILFDVEAWFSAQVSRLHNTFEGDCLLISFYLTRDVARILNHSLSVDRLMRTGYSIRHSDHLQLVPKLVNGEPLELPPWDLWALGKTSRTVRKAKDFILSCKYNRKKLPWAVADHFRPGRRVFAFPNENVVGRRHVKNHSKWVRLTSPEEWLDLSLVVPVSTDSMKIFNDTAQEWADMAVGYAHESHDLELGPWIRQSLVDHIQQTLCHIAEVYSAILRVVAKLKPERILAPSGGKPLVRAVNLAVRRNGGKATGHPHGYFICHSSSPRHILLELSTVDEFMVYTPGSIPLFYRHMKSPPFPIENNVVISHDNFDELYRTWKGWKDKPVPERIRTVMVLELYFIFEYASYHITDTMVSYHFYYNLCKFLSDSGYKVIFKRRPKDHGWEGINIFESIPNVELEYRPFEAPGVIDRADAVITHYAMSSTLYYSMCTNKTIIYIDAGWESWFPDVYEPMGKRCRILNCWYDENNRQCFDDSQLLGILEQRPEQPDTEFLEKYLFPDGSEPCAE